MSRKHPTPKADDLFGPADSQLLDLIRSHDAILRSALCTLARRGVAFRKSQPNRAAQWLDHLSRHPVFKGGQFLFDLLEWEDFMLDGPPPPLLGEPEILALLNRIAQAIGAAQGQTTNLGFVFQPTGSKDASALPPLEAGFYLYRDVVLGVLGYLTQGITKSAN
ncbi:MAG TPA: hypothetical protein VGF13_18030 [Verrucomicrobiae bacterium]|jgi:hypothetical protein